MNEKLYIPEKLNVGFQNRTSTYTGKLGYVIYWDEKGKLRKETSWNSWRDNKIDPEVHENVACEGFVLNKNEGGVSNYSSWGWHDRIEKCRVFDPRGFEFEITIPNLLYILQECNSVKGKGLEGEFVYAWSGKELVLLPVQSREYEKCKEYTTLQAKKFSLRDLVVGNDYLTKGQNKVCYIGKHHFCENEKWNSSLHLITKNHIFYKYNHYTKFTSKSIKIAEEIGPSKDFNDIVEEFEKKYDNKKIKSVFLEPIEIDKGYVCSYKWFGFSKESDSYNIYNIKYKSRYGYVYNSSSYEVDSINWYGNCKLQDGVLKIQPKIKQPTTIPDIKDLKFIGVELENGKKYVKQAYWNPID